MISVCDLTRGLDEYVVEEETDALREADQVQSNLSHCASVEWVAENKDWAPRERDASRRVTGVGRCRQSRDRDSTGGDQPITETLPGMEIPA